MFLLIMILYGKVIQNMKAKTAAGMIYRLVRKTV